MPMYRAFAAFFKGDTGDTRLTHWQVGERDLHVLQSTQKKLILERIERKSGT